MQSGATAQLCVVLPHSLTRPSTEAGWPHPGHLCEICTGITLTTVLAESRQPALHTDCTAPA